MSLPLHLKYRPKNFNEIVGNKSVVDSIKSVLGRKEGLPHSFMFIGPSGCGKTTLARILKRYFDCDDMDFHELNVANVRGIDTIREVAQAATFYPLNGKSKIFLLDEAHKLTNDAQNALLKLLEDTPEFVYLILCTTDANKMIKTIRTRCTTYEVKLLDYKEMKSLITDILNKEKVKLPSEAIEEIIKAADGSPRQALVILDSVIDIPDDDNLIKAIVSYTATEKTVKDLCQILLKKANWKDIAGVLKALDEDPEKIRYAVLGYMQAVLLNGENDQAALVIEQFLTSFMYSGKPGLTYACYMTIK